MMTSMTVPLGKRHSLKRQYVDFISDDDDDDDDDDVDDDDDDEPNFPRYKYGGPVDSDEDDSLERLDAINSTLTGKEAREQSKVSVTPISSIFIPPHSHVNKASVIIIPGPSAPSPVMFGKRHSLKRQFLTYKYGGPVDEDEDDSLERLAALNGTLTGKEAREQSKVSVTSTSFIFIPPHM